MKQNELGCGDIVVVNENGYIYKAILIAHCTNNRPLILRISDLECDIYNPRQIAYEDIIVAQKRVNIKKALLKAYRKIN